MTDRASRTAVLVCQGRAVAHGRVVPTRFADALAIDLLDDDERTVVDLARAGTPPQGARARLEYERALAVGEGMVPRTVAIDDAVRAALHPQLVVLGAGLDDRAWRMTEVTGLDVFEVDHPASQVDKRRRVVRLPPPFAQVHFVGVDFERDDLGAALAGAGHRVEVPTTWVWEGVVAYLTTDDVEATLRLLSGRSARGSRLVVNYQAPSLRARLGRRLAALAARLSGADDPLAGEPWRSLWRPSAMGALLVRHGWRVISDDDLLTLAEQLEMTVDHRRSLASGRVVVADR